LGLYGGRSLCDHAPTMDRADDLAVHVLRKGYPLRIKARGASMFPLVRDGDVVTVTPAVRTQVRVGDVICYERLPGRLVVHRVIARAHDRLLAKGDALAGVDSVHAAQLLGKVTVIERFGRVSRLDTYAARLGNRLMAVLSRRTPLFPVAIDVARRVRAAARG
jgi:signal peptidase I